MLVNQRLTPTLMLPQLMLLLMQPTPKHPARMRP